METYVVKFKPVSRTTWAYMTHWHADVYSWPDPSSDRVVRFESKAKAIMYWRHHHGYNSSFGGHLDFNDWAELVPFSEAKEEPGLPDIGVDKQKELLGQKKCASCGQWIPWK